MRPLPISTTTKWQGRAPDEHTHVSLVLKHKEWLAEGERMGLEQVNILSKSDQTPSMNNSNFPSLRESKLEEIELLGCSQISLGSQVLFDVISCNAGRLKSPCCAGLLVAVLSVAVGGASRASFEYLTQLSAERMVFQTDFGRLEMAFYPKVGDKFSPWRHQYLVFWNRFWGLLAHTKQRYQSVHVSAGEGTCRSFTLSIKLKSNGGGGKLMFRLVKLWNKGSTSSGMQAGLPQDILTSS